MLNKTNRLRSDRDIQRVFKSGRFVSSPALTVKSVPNRLPDSRFAFVVGVKVSKRAVKRNLIRRRLREIVRRLLPELRAGFDVMIAARSAALDLGFIKLEEELRRALTRSGLLPPNR